MSLASPTDLVNTPRSSMIGVTIRGYPYRRARAWITAWSASKAAASSGSRSRIPRGAWKVGIGRLTISRYRRTRTNRRVKAAAGGTTTTEPTKATVELANGGSFSFTLRPDKAPKTVERFVAKARSGFYDGLVFHRVEDWVVQGGDPKGTGTGGERVPSE